MCQFAKIIIVSCAIKGISQASKLHVCCRGSLFEKFLETVKWRSTLKGLNWGKVNDKCFWWIDYKRSKNFAINAGSFVSTQRVIMINLLRCWVNKVSNLHNFETFFLACCPIEILTLLLFYSYLYRAKILW